MWVFSLVIDGLLEVEMLEFEVVHKAHQFFAKHSQNREAIQQFVLLFMNKAITKNMGLFSIDVPEYHYCSSLPQHLTSRRVFVITEQFPDSSKLFLFF